MWKEKRWLQGLFDHHFYYNSPEKSYYAPVLHWFCVVIGFDHGSRQVKREPVDLITVDYDIILRYRIPPVLYIIEEKNLHKHSCLLVKLPIFLILRKVLVGRNYYTLFLFIGIWKELKGKASSITVNFFLTAQVPLNETFGWELATW